MPSNTSDQACRDALYDTIHPLCETDDSTPLQQRGPEHLGLALTRCVPTFKTNANATDYEKERKQLYTRFAGISNREAYKLALNRWKRVLKTSETVWQFSGVLASPLAMGLGLDAPMEAGIRLHHTYGTPLIPGSALKGITRQAARVWRQRANLDAKDFEAVIGVVFGDTKQSGVCIFHDAWWEKGGNNQMAARDTITVHHPLYYQGGESTTEWPSDFDDPTPISFLVVPAQAQFQFALDIPTGWEELVLDLVQWSLMEFGVGGKRNAGYGRFGSAWGAVPRPRFEEASGWWFEPIGTGARIYPDGNEAAAITLTVEQLETLTKSWSAEQKENLGMVSFRQKVEESREPVIVRLDWLEG